MKASTAVFILHNPEMYPIVAALALAVPQNQIHGYRDCSRDNFPASGTTDQARWQMITTQRERPTMAEATRDRRQTIRSSFPD